ncbi:putative Clr5 domain-containing protein [Seiridium cardinale]|uniref:Clr5 domain-containing protein n=1 Tax=Seiridium cardinale TaxID=138064 RepID=A0ABR2XAX7_9PEZI
MSSANATSSSRVSKQRTRAAKTKEWEHYKDEILRLYMIENFTLDQMSVHMLKEHRFDKKKHQYEHNLRRWGVRKNLRKEDWEFMSRTIQQRQRQQKESEVLLYGALLSESRKNRALQRYGHDMFSARRFGAAASPGRPENYPIRIASPPITESRVIVWPNSLPWLQFESNFQIPTPLSPKLLDILTEAIAFSGASLTTVDVERINLTHAIHHVLRELPSGAVSLTRLLPYVPTSSQESATTSELENPNDLAFQLLRNFLFQLSNKAVRSDFEEEEEKRQYDINLLRLVHELHPVALDRLLTSPDSTSKAIRESCYRAAVLLSDYALVSKLLEAGTDPNILSHAYLFIQHEKYRGKASYSDSIDTLTATGLQIAASHCDLSLAILLIDAGAKVDLGDPTPLQILCSSDQHPETLGFADLLISKGARLNTRHKFPPLSGAVQTGNKSLIDLLLSRGAMSEIVIGTPWEDSLGKLVPNLDFHYVWIGNYHMPVWESPIKNSSVTSLQLAIGDNDGSIISTLISAALKQRDRNEILELAFITACLAGDQDTVQKLLHLNPQIIHNQSLINSAFLAISWIHDCRIAYLLFEAGARPRVLGTPHVSTLQAAALYGNSSLIRLLKSYGSDINFGTGLDFRDRFRGRMASPPSTPLECAMYTGHSETAELLLELGANVAGKHLLLSVIYGSHALVIKILARYQNTNEPYRGQRVLDYAIRGGKGLALIRTLIGAGATLGGYELVHAVHGNDKEVIQFLISLGFPGVYSSVEYRAPLSVAVEIGNVQYVRAILEAGAKVDCGFTWITPFCTATKPGYLKTALLLLDHGADINANGSMALVDASELGDLKVAMFLLKHGAYIDAPAGVEQGFTALEKAAEYGKIDMVELLLNHGADFRGRNRIRFVRAVNFATMSCHHATAELLREHGGWTAEDLELAKEERAYEYDHLCPRFLYNDWSWEGYCWFCNEHSAPAEGSGSSEDDDSAASSIASLVSVDEPSTTSGLEFRFDDLSMLEDEPNVLQEEGDDLSLVTYSARDRELDDIVMRLLDEDGIL